MYQFIIFDIDGTLIDTEYTTLHSLQRAASESLGRPVRIEELRFSFGIPGRDALAALNVPDIEECLARWTGYFNELRAHNILYPGVIETLMALRLRGVLLGVATSRLQSELNPEFAAMGLAPLIDVVVNADDTTEHKPNPAPILKALEWAGLHSPKGALYVGDTPHDCSAAHGAGVPFALASWGAHDMSIPAEHVLQSLEELLPLCAPFPRSSSPAQI